MSNTYALILAGGSGTRFWPLSRDRKPKQLLNLFDDETLLEKTVNRLKGIVPVENILILTNEVQKSGVHAACPQLPKENVIAEPARRDTAPAIALGIGWVAARDPEATMMVLPSDQLIQDEAAYAEVMAGAVEIASKSDALVTVGIKPTWACPGYGYIERAAKAEIDGLESNVAAYEVECFREKPSPEVAQEYLDKGTFTWNAGMFIWSVPAVTAELRSHVPELAGFIDEVKESKNFDALLVEKFPKLPKISIDFALMEKASRVINVEATFDWDDVGSWISVAKYLDQDDEGNSANAEGTRIASENNIIYSVKGSRHVAMLGVRDLIVVQTDDALLIADRNDPDAIKKLVEQVPRDLIE